MTIRSGKIILQGLPKGVNPRPLNTCSKFGYVEQMIGRAVSYVACSSLIHDKNTSIKWIINEIVKKFHSLTGICDIMDYEFVKFRSTESITCKSKDTVVLRFTIQVWNEDDKNYQWYFYNHEVTWAGLKARLIEAYQPVAIKAVKADAHKKATAKIKYNEDCNIVRDLRRKLESGDTSIIVVIL